MCELIKGKMRGAWGAVSGFFIRIGRWFIFCIPIWKMLLNIKSWYNDPSTRKYSKKFNSTRGKSRNVDAYKTPSAKKKMMNNVERKVDYLFEKNEQKGNKLTSGKKQNVIDLIDTLNARNTFAAVHGGQGVGKSSVVRMATRSIFLPTKGFFNLVAILFLSILLLVFFWLHPMRIWIMKRLMMRRWKIHEINIWNIFGHRDLREYFTIKRTAHWRPENTARNKDVIPKHRISSVNPVGEKEEDKKLLSSWLFIKNSIWREIFSRISLVGKFKYRLKSSLFDYGYSVDVKISTFRKTFAFFVILIFVFFTFYVIGAGIEILISGNDVKHIFEDEALISGLATASSTTTLKVIASLLWKTQVKEANDFMVDPISNTSIERYIAKKTRNNFTILHISELDRFVSRLYEASNGDDYKIIPDIIRYIIESICLSYSAENVNIIFEIDDVVMNVVQSGKEDRRWIHKKIHLDMHSKLFDNIIHVEPFNKNEFTSAVKEVISNTMVWNSILESLTKKYYDYLTRKYELNESFKSWRHITDATINIVWFYDTWLSEGDIKNDSPVNISFDTDVFFNYKFKLEQNLSENDDYVYRSKPQLYVRDMFSHGTKQNIERLFMFENPHIHLKTNTRYISRENASVSSFSQNGLSKLAGTTPFKNKFIGLLLLDFMEEYGYNHVYRRIDIDGFVDAGFLRKLPEVFNIVYRRKEFDVRIKMLYSLYDFMYAITSETFKPCIAEDVLTMLKNDPHSYKKFKISLVRTLYAEGVFEGYENLLSPDIFDKKFFVNMSSMWFDFWIKIVNKKQKLRRKVWSNYYDRPMIRELKEEDYAIITGRNRRFMSF